MKKYRFKLNEIEAMKKEILASISCEKELKTAWRLHCALTGLLWCCPGSKKVKAKQHRELSLFESLTTPDFLPNFL